MLVLPNHEDTELSLEIVEDKTKFLSTNSDNNISTFDSKIEINSSNDNTTKIVSVNNDENEKNIIFNAPLSLNDNLTVGNSNLFVDSGHNKVGINKSTPEYELDVSGSTNISNDLSVGNDNLIVNSVQNKIGINKSTPEYELDVIGSTNISSNLSLVLSKFRSIRICQYFK